MKIVPFILFCVLCVGMNVVYTLFCKSKGYKGLLVRGLTILSCLGLALISSNLNSLTNSLPLLVFFGLALMLMSEAMIVSEIDEEKPKMIVFGVLSCASNLMFALSTMSISEFNVFAFFGGILLGVGLGCVVCAIKKYKKWYQVLSTLLTFSAIGFFLSEAVYGVLASSHLITATIMVGAAVLMLVQKFIKCFVQEGTAAYYVASAFYVLASILISCSIYFY